MKVGIHQPEHFPWLGFFDKMDQCDVYVILDSVQFEKNYFQNRNKIRTGNGWEWITVPVFIKGRSKQKINEVEIDNKSDWQKTCWKKLWLNYQKALYWQKHKDFFEKIYQKNWQKLVDLNKTIIFYLAEGLGIQKRFILASDLNVTGKASILLLNICQKLEASVYLSGKSGRDYLDESLFSKAGIKIEYQDFKHPDYQQLYKPFLPNMSTVDLLFNEGPCSLKIIREANGR